MGKFPTTRVVYDRKRTATNSSAALVQIEILYGRKKKYVSTGVRVCKNKWSENKGKVQGLITADVLNSQISAIKAHIDKGLSALISSGEPITAETIDRYISTNEARQSFIDFVEERIESRTDITESSKRTQRKLPGSLRQFGRIINFSDLTRDNIEAYDNFLRQKGLRQTSVWSYHKTMKTYVNEAIKRGLLQSSPYSLIKIKRGESEHGRWLTETEFSQIRNVKLPTESLNNVRDCFVVQCLTGLSYSDLMKVDFSKPQEDAGRYYLTGERTKTGETFCTVLLPDVLQIVNRHGGRLPKFSNQQYNIRLKAVAEIAGIDKPVASHWGRRTCGMLLLNKGVSIEVVARVLGHSSIRTTEAVYAKILDKSVVEEVTKKCGIKT